MVRKQLDGKALFQVGNSYAAVIIASLLSLSWVLLRLLLPKLTIFNSIPLVLFSVFKHTHEIVLNYDYVENVNR